MAALKNLFRLFMVAPPGCFFLDHPIGVERMSIDSTAIAATYTAVILRSRALARRLEG
jgi:hypothetical protein